MSADLSGSMVQGPAIDLDHVADDGGARSRRDEPGLQKLCVFLADLHGGGAERMMVQLANGFSERGVAVDLVLAHAVGPYLEEVSAEVRIIDLARGRVVRAIRPFARYLRRERPDVVFTTLEHASLAAAMARVMAAVPTALVIREANTPSRRRIARLDIKAQLMYASMRAVYAVADGIVAVSEGVRDDLHRHRGVEAKKVWTLYSPLVSHELLQLSSEEPDHDWMRDGSVPVLLGVGSLRPHKGFRTLLEAVRNVRLKRDVRLVVLGEGPQRGELEAYARRLGLADHVDFVGFRVNPFAYMARAAAFVLSSEREGLPGVLVQAMACGCPVVATDCLSGPSEVLRDGDFGRLVAVGDADAMGEAIIATLDAPLGGRELRDRAARFASDPVIDDHLDAFDRVVRVRVEPHRRVRRGGSGRA